MARHITYDAAEVRSRLLDEFWKSGYAETSLSDLERATGLNRRQLYNGPGDKKAMFLGALDDFNRIAGAEFLAPLEQDDAGVGDIAKLLRTFVALAGTDKGRNGCLVCSASQEEIAEDGDVRTKIDAYFARIQSAYRNALTQAVSRREIALSPSAVANKSAQLLGIHVALCVLGRAEFSTEKLKRMAEETIRSLG